MNSFGISLMRQFYFMSYDSFGNQFYLTLAISWFNKDRKTTLVPFHTTYLQNEDAISMYSNYVLFNVLFNKLRTFQQMYKCGLTIFTVTPRQPNDSTISTQLGSRTKSLLEEAPIFLIKSTKSRLQQPNYKLTCVDKENSSSYKLYYTQVRVQATRSSSKVKL